MRRSLLATLRYALRLHTRPTPFGTFAGVSTATLGTPAVATVGSAHGRHVRLDQGWAASRRDRTPGDTVVAQPLLTTRGGRVINPTLPDQSVSVARSPLLERVLQHAQEPVAIGELAQLVQELVPDADPAQARGYVDQLRSERFLLEGRRPTSAVDGVPGLAAAVQTYVEAPPTDRRARWQAAERVAQEHHRGSGPLHVDLQMDAQLIVPPGVAGEVATAAEALCRLAPDLAASAALEAYHDRFLHRFGTDRLVPMAELLDSHRGLGAPDGYQHPAAARPDPGTAAPAQRTERDEILADLTADGQSELVLDAGTIESLATPSDRPPPRTFDLGVSLHANDARALARGDYLLACSNGSTTGGATIGRFARMLGVETSLRDLVDREQADVVAELLAPTPDPRQSNVTPPTGALAASVELGLVASDEPPDRIALRDVAIGSTGRTLYAVDTRSRRVIDPVRLNMVNPTTALPNPARLLSALALGGRRMWSPWDWGGLAALPHRPRVRLGRVVLAPQRWRPSTAVRDAADDPSRFTEALLRWRDARNVPPQVRIADGDQRLDLDLDHALHRALLRDHLRRHRDALVEESARGWCAAHGIADPHGLMDGHACELALPILTPGHAERVGPPQVPWTSLSTPPIRHLPGGAWVSAKIYADADAHDRLISTGLDGLLDQVDPAAYLLRYADPDPHVRVRVPAGEGRALQALHEWSTQATASALVRTVAIDEYAPEVDRYGGLAAMPAAEALFAQDSALVRRLLADTSLSEVPGGRPTIAAASCLDLLESFAGADVSTWLLTVLPAAVSHQVPTGTRRAAHPVVLGDFSQIADGRVAAPVSARRAAAAEHGRIAGPLHGGGHSPALSLMHLHCNRLLGLSQAQEHAAYGILRSAVSARAGRRRTSA